MGTTTTNLGLYKPAIGETGWGALVDGNFDTLDAQFGSGRTSIMYVSPLGDNSNDGFSWGTAKLDVVSAYAALPRYVAGGSEGGVIMIADGASMDSADATHGLWLIGENDDIYSDPEPTGFLRNMNVAFIGVPSYAAGYQPASGARRPQAKIICAGMTDRTRPALWFATTNRNLLFRDLNFDGAARTMLMGVGANGTSPAGGESSSVYFDNCGFSVAQVAGGGPNIDFGSTIGIWIDFRDCTFNGNVTPYSISAASITAGTTARFTTTITHFLEVGDTVATTGFTPAGYNSGNGAVWTVSAVTGTTFDCDIGTSPAAASVMGTAKPIDSYRRAALAGDQRKYARANPIANYLNCNFNAGGIYWYLDPAAGAYYSGMRVDSAVMEGEWVGVQPALVRVKTASTSTALPGTLKKMQVNQVELADGLWLNGAVHVDGLQTDPAIFTLSNVYNSDGPAGVGQMWNVPHAAMRRQNGVLSGRKDVLLLGQHDGGRRTFAPTAVRYVNSIDQDASTWTVGTATLTSSTIAGPDGVANAARITSTGGAQKKTFGGKYSFTTVVGDYVVAGVWRRTTVAGHIYSASDHAYLSFSNSSNKFEESGLETLTLNTYDIRDDDGWTWEYQVSKISASSGGNINLEMYGQADLGAVGVIDYYAPVMIYIPVASVISKPDVYEYARHIAPYPSSASAGQVAMLRGQSLHVPKGYIEMAEVTAPAAGATNFGRVYMEDNGAGKTRLVVKFPTGAAQVIATEP